MESKKAQNIPANLVVIISFLIDISDIVLSLAAAILSGSVVMLAQVLEGVSDLTSSGFLVIGLVRANHKADKTHPYGYGRELYVWALLSGIITFAITATLSIYFGWNRFVHPEPVRNLNLVFLVLAVTAFTNSFAFYLSLKRLLRGRSWSSVVNIFLHTSLIETKTTFVLDLMGTAASLLGIIALLVYKLTGDYRYDGLGAILIGAVLAVLAYILLMDVVDLIIGRSASKEVENEIRLTALSIPNVEKIMELKTLHIGSEKLLVNLEVHLTHGLTTIQIERLINTIKGNIQKQVPQVKHIQIELESLSTSN